MFRSKLTRLALLLSLLAAPALAATPVSPSLAFTLPDQTGIVEGIAYRASSGDYFFGDVHHRCVWRRDRAGALTRFSPPGDALYGVFNLVLDEAHGLLWAATSMLPETAGFTPADEGRAALVALDLATGRVVRTHPLPADQRNHVLGDLLLAPDGAVYLTDSLAPIVWRLAPGAAALEIFVESPLLRSPQGIAFVVGGKKILVGDYSRGLFTLDPATRELRPLALPADTPALRGLDGLLVRDREILAVYNGREPCRVLRLTLSPDASTVLTADAVTAPDPAFNDLTLLTPVGDQLQIVANSGWALADAKKSPAIPSHPVRIFSFPWPAAAP